jgi:UDP-2,3-diacylglucosamine pyrophosphatase LpxH
MRSGSPLYRLDDRRDVRTLFLSDVHLGCPYAKTAAALRLLESCEPDAIYLVGDFVDGWRLKKRWRWRPDHTAILQRLLQWESLGTQ